MNTPIEQLPIDRIVTGERLRSDLGDIDGLAESIQEFGLLHPLIVDDNDNLIAGHRRLKALRQLGFLDVSVRRWGSLDANQRRVIELEENIRRKDLTDAERSRKLVELAEAAREIDVTEFRPDSGRNSQGGRPETQGSSRRVAERIGIPRTTIQKAESHVAAVDAYPFLEQPGWKQYHAMEAAEALDKLPEAERSAIAKLIDQPGIPPRDAIRTLQNVANKPEPERKKIIALSQSADDRDRSLALTTAAAVPAMPDPRLGCITVMVLEAKKAIKFYPNDPEVPDFRKVIDQLSEIANAIRERTKHVDFAAD